MTEYDYFGIRDILRKVADKINQMEGEIPNLEDVFEDVERAAKVKVCVAPEFWKSVDEMGRATRDQVVMVRIDKETREALDAWVSTGAVKSRSEAAALFIREGLDVRGSELDELRDALKDVDKAKEKLRERAKKIFGQDEEADEPEDSADA